LTYHRLGQAAQGALDPFLCTRTDDFDVQLKALADAGYRTVSLDELVSGKECAGPRIAITFDDGFVSALREGLPVLARHNARAIQFIVAGLVGKQNEWDIEKRDVAEPLMSEAQIKEWLAAGHQIGSHSVKHRNLKKLSLAEAREEIFASKKLLEDQFGVAVKHFCYPFGGWNPAVRDLVIEAGYTTASTVVFGVNPPDCDRFTLRRIMPYSSSNLLRKALHRAVRKA
jgi:peptidoglycan/xylan/chitin deacetylase (PgdA/CDA1 family)